MKVVEKLSCQNFFLRSLIKTRIHAQSHVYTQFNNDDDVLVI